MDGKVRYRHSWRIGRIHGCIVLEFNGDQELLCFESSPKFAFSTWAYHIWKRKYPLYLYVALLGYARIVMDIKCVVFS